MQIPFLNLQGSLSVIRVDATDAQRKVRNVHKKGENT
jgi:hypothetical protein